MPTDTETTTTAEVLTRLVRIEALLAGMAAQPVVRDWYTVDEFAAAVGLVPFTVREHCRLGRLDGVKKASGRGKHHAWVLSHAELLRYRREGLLPLPRLRLKG